MSEEKKNVYTITGGYRNLITYQKSEIIYDGTVYFCNRFFDKYNRTDAAGRS
jgi:hypothetical protein